MIDNFYHNHVNDVLDESIAKAQFLSIGDENPPGEREDMSNWEQYEATMQRVHFKQADKTYGARIEQGLFTYNSAQPTHIIV